MGRPRGAVRDALLDAARQLATEQGGATWREVAHRAKVGFAQARQTVWAMVKCGELVVIGYRPVAGTNRPAAVFSLPIAVEQAQSGQLLDEVVTTWLRTRLEG